MMRLPAPAKINRFLHIVGRRDDGYHLLQTVFQFLDWHDTLEFALREDDKIVLLGDTLGIAPEDNLIYRAAKALQSLQPDLPGVTITIDKQLPAGAGLGGGSSNAATTLVALNSLWSLHLSSETLQDIGTTLGADVPIFIYGQAAFAQGIGDTFTPSSPPESYYVMILPAAHACTASFYQSPDLVRNTPTISPVELVHAQTHNAFEALARAAEPLIDEAFRAAQVFGTPRLTGSGSALFLEFGNLAEAKNVQKQLPKGLNTRVCRGHNISPLAQITRESR